MIKFYNKFFKVLQNSELFTYFLDEPVNQNFKYEELTNLINITKDQLINLVFSQKNNSTNYLWNPASKQAINKFFFVVYEHLMSPYKLLAIIIQLFFRKEPIGLSRTEKRIFQKEVGIFRKRTAIMLLNLWIKLRYQDFKYSHPILENMLSFFCIKTLKFLEDEKKSLANHKGSKNNSHQKNLQSLKKELKNLFNDIQIEIGDENHPTITDDLKFFYAKTYKNDQTFFKLDVLDLDGKKSNSDHSNSINISMSEPLLSSPITIKKKYSTINMCFYNENQSDFNDMNLLVKNKVDYLEIFPGETLDDNVIERAKNQLMESSCDEITQVLCYINLKLQKSISCYDLFPKRLKKGIFEGNYECYTNRFNSLLWWQRLIVIYETDIEKMADILIKYTEILHKLTTLYEFLDHEAINVFIKTLEFLETFVRYGIPELNSLYEKKIQEKNLEFLKEQNLERFKLKHFNALKHLKSLNEGDATINIYENKQVAVAFLFEIIRFFIRKDTRWQLMVKAESPRNENFGNTMINVSDYGMNSVDNLPKLEEINSPNKHKNNFQYQHDPSRERCSTWNQHRMQNDKSYNSYSKYRSLKVPKIDGNVTLPGKFNHKHKESENRASIRLPEHSFEDSKYSTKNEGKFGLGVDKKEELVFINMKKLSLLCDVYIELETLQKSRNNLKFLSERKYLENTNLYKLLLYDYLKIIMFYQKTDNPFDISDTGIMEIIKKKRKVLKLKATIQKLVARKLRENWSFLKTE